MPRIITHPLLPGRSENEIERIRHETTRKKLTTTDSATPTSQNLKTMKNSCRKYPITLKSRRVEKKNQNCKKRFAKFKTQNSGKVLTNAAEVSATFKILVIFPRPHYGLARSFHNHSSAHHPTPPNPIMSQ